MRRAHARELASARARPGAAERSWRMCWLARPSGMPESHVLGHIESVEGIKREPVPGNVGLVRALLELIARRARAT